MSGFGAYGKIPALGDFFRIHAQPAFVTAWDRWMQQVLRQGRAGLGSRWEACYMSAPIWRFALPAGVLGPRGVFGVVMPSVDRVGRQFPLVLVSAFEGDPILLHDSQSALYEQLENIALSALDDDMTPARLGQELAALPMLPTAPTPPSAMGKWSAVLLDGVREIRCSGLPVGADVLRLFDPAPVSDVVVP